MGEMAGLWDYIGISPTGAVAVVAATVVLYVVFVVLTRVLGQRVLTSLSSSDQIVVIVLGAILGRAALGQTPTMAGGIIALATFFVLEALIGSLGAWPPGERLINNKPVLLMAGPVFLEDHLRRHRISELELRSRLRQAGIRNDDEVAAVVLEPTGAVSVLHVGEPIDPRMLVGVRGAERVPRDLLLGG